MLLHLFFPPFFLVCKFSEAWDGVFTVVFWDPGPATAVYDVLEKHPGGERMNEKYRVPDLTSTGLVIEIDDCFTGLEIQN